MAENNGKVVVTTTTYYPDPNGVDKVRFGLACELVKLAVHGGHKVVIVDGSPTMEVGTRLHNLGAHVFPQAEKGMGHSRRQVWREAENFISDGIVAVLWTEPEKTDIIRHIPAMLVCMEENKADIVIPRRTPESWKTYPAFQEKSEGIANLVYSRLFAGGPWDPMFGPIIFRPEKISWFATFMPAGLGLPDTYIQHFVPRGVPTLTSTKIALVDVDFVYPPEQKVEEESVASGAMLEKRLWQLRQLVDAYFILHKHFGS